jgi:hypothetical protein
MVRFTQRQAVHNCAERLVQPHTAADGGPAVLRGLLLQAWLRDGSAPAAEREAFGSHLK